MTAHEEFKFIDFKNLKYLMKTPIVIDGRRIYNPDELRKMGFNYKGIGATNEFNMGVVNEITNSSVLKTQKTKNGS